MRCAQNSLLSVLSKFLIHQGNEYLILISLQRACQMIPRQTIGYVTISCASTARPDCRSRELSRTYCRTSRNLATKLLYSIRRGFVSTMNPEEEGKGYRGHHFPIMNLERITAYNVLGIGAIWGMSGSPFMIERNGALSYVSALQRRTHLEPS